MTAINLKPSFELLSQEYVLVQAWEKTANTCDRIVRLEGATCRRVNTPVRFVRLIKQLDLASMRNVNLQFCLRRFLRGQK